MWRAANITRSENSFMFVGDSRSGEQFKQFVAHIVGGPLSCGAKGQRRPYCRIDDQRLHFRAVSIPCYHWFFSVATFAKRMYVKANAKVNRKSQIWHYHVRLGNDEEIGSAVMNLCMREKNPFSCEIFGDFYLSIPNFVGATGHIFGTIWTHTC